MTNEVILIGELAVETKSILVAARVARRACQLPEVRGSVKVNGKPVRFSTIQQFEHHGGFERVGT